jgi:hypothetical protein
LPANIKNVLSLAIVIMAQQGVLTSSTKWRVLHISTDRYFLRLANSLGLKNKAERVVPVTLLKMVLPHPPKILLYFPSRYIQMYRFYITVYIF